MDSLANYISKLGDNKKQVLIIGHPHADPDAVSSVIALGELLKFTGCEVETVIPQGLSKISKNVLQSIGLDVETTPELKADVIIVLDTPSLDQLEDYGAKIESSDCKLIFIDHHHRNTGTGQRVEKYYVYEGFSSTAEIILELGKKFDYRFSPKTALGLLTGIITDTGHLKFANEETFRAIALLIEMGADYQKALEALKTPEDPSKRVAMLKAMTRAELHKAHGKWIVFSEIGAYESDAASLFLKIGADLAAVANKGDGALRISMRSQKDIQKNTDLHLGKIAEKIADQFNGTGGGHVGASGVNIKNDFEFEEVKKKTLKELKKNLNTSL